MSGLDRTERTVVFSMTFRSHSTVVRGVARPKRQTLWFFFAPAANTVSGGSAVLTHSLNAAALALRPFTIVRSRIEIFIRSDQVAATEDQSAALGFAVVSDQASAIGVTAIPTPVTDMGSDLWFVHQNLFGSEFGDSAGGNGAARGRGWIVDSKAQRKVEDGQDVIAAVEDAGLGGGTRIFMAGRVLIKTH